MLRIQPTFLPRLKWLSSRSLILVLLMKFNDFRFTKSWAWTRALVNLNSEEIHVCGDKSALNLVQKIVDLCGDSLEVKNYERMTSLVPQRKPT